MSQEDVFWNGEGDQWHIRNKDALFKPLVVAPILQLKLPNKPKIIEIGCGDGFYISLFQKSFHADAIGIDPSAMAIMAAKKEHPNVTFVRGNVHNVLEPADLIIFGFCLYLVDRESLFEVVSNADYALKEGGYLVIHDFDPSFPRAVPYHHKEGVWSYKMDYPALWLANPAYQMISKTKTAEGEAVTILRKGSWDQWRRP
jgi:SAM-dependent methyltransferase